MSGPVGFPFATGSDEDAAEFVGHFLAPPFGPPEAVDSRLVDGLWTHQLYQPDTLAAERARYAAAWQHQRETEAAQYREQMGEDL